MMKRIILTSLFCLSAIIVFARINSDSLAYQLERTKINAMLARRAIKFGRYDASLSMHTGIFGLQTKKDIRRSNDILMDIVKTDDSIYKELKILLDFSGFQRVQVLNHSQETEENNIGFMTTINKLRNQVDQLKADATKQQQQYKKAQGLFILALIFLLASILYLVSRQRRPTA